MRTCIAAVSIWLLPALASGAPLADRGDDLERGIRLLHQLIRFDEGTPGSSDHETAALAASVARAHGINPNFFLALIEVESGFQQHAVSHAGAIGLCQLMPQTARALGVDPHDERGNLTGGARYLRAQLITFRSVEHALWAYNAGPEHIRTGRRVPTESRRFARAVIAHFERLERQSSRSVK